MSDVPGMSSDMSDNSFYVLLSNTVSIPTVCMDTIKLPDSRSARHFSPRLHGRDLKRTYKLT